jgi:hypothetical protein
MLPIVVVWTQYTATVSGRIMKLVPCEHCGTEYVYGLEREAEGFGNSVYLLNEDGAKAHAQASADETLRSYLENDFDPVPCPACGHYQRYMFPKLYDGGSAWGQLARLALLGIACPTVVGAMYWGSTYILHSSTRAMARLGGALIVLSVLGLVDVALRAAERSRARRFDPNTEDQQARIAKGRSRAVTRAEFEAEQQREREARGGAASEQEPPPPHPG